MDPAAIHEWARAHGAPIPDAYGRRAYRCAAHLIDGTHLPCVLLREAGTQTAAVAALLGQRAGGDHAAQASFVNTLATGGNRVEATLVARLEPSRHAIAWELLSTLPGELRFSPVEFAATMDDGAVVSFGTAFDLAFFEMPPDY